jgi:D-alanyl-lipoteichoic acid acyltransferase DltB (MBOAT superfamily)
VGLWHGASWNFILFGANAGLFVVLETAGKLSWVTKRTWLAYPYVLLFWALSAVFFRAGSLEQIGAYLAGMFGAAGRGTGPVDPRWALVLPAFLAVHVAASRGLFRGLERLPDWAFALVLGAAVALALPWVSVGYQAFVYFQF